jgi:sterol desaturase/sphingolipid hydroxylase (fatty acid hydroxylase superfamily)
VISLALVYVGLALVAPLCALAQRMIPADDATPRVFTRARLTDWSYWLVTPIGTGFFTRASTLGAAAAIAFAMGWAFHDADDLLLVFSARSPLARWPLPLQCVLALVIADFVSYWSHRLRHHARFFPLHAVHHSAEMLDWLAAARLHPLDDLFDNVVVTLPVLVLGFDPRIFLALGPFLLLHTLYLHSSVRLSLGPLRYVLASPDFHRWHHSVDLAAQNANYAGVFSIWDVMFGTFRMPEHERATRFGLDTGKLPESLGAQLVIPVTRLAQPGR